MRCVDELDTFQLICVRSGSCSEFRSELERSKCRVEVRLTIAR